MPVEISLNNTEQLIRWWRHRVIIWGYYDYRASRNFARKNFRAFDRPAHQCSARSLNLKSVRRITGQVDVVELRGKLAPFFLHLFRNKWASIPGSGVWGGGGRMQTLTSNPVRPRCENARGTPLNYSARQFLARCASSTCCVVTFERLRVPQRGRENRTAVNKGGGRVFPTMVCTEFVSGIEGSLTKRQFLIKYSDEHNRLFLYKRFTVDYPPPTNHCYWLFFTTDIYNNSFNIL